MLSEAWEKGRGGPGGGEIPATCENSQTQTITEGQPGYQEAEVGLEQVQVRRGHMFVQGFVGSVDATLETSVIKLHMAVTVFKSPAVFLDHNR